MRPACRHLASTREAAPVHLSVCAERKGVDGRATTTAAAAASSWPPPECDAAAGDGALCCLDGPCQLLLAVALDLHQQRRRPLPRGDQARSQVLQRGLSQPGRQAGRCDEWPAARWWGAHGVAAVSRTVEVSCWAAEGEDSDVCAHTDTHIAWMHVETHQPNLIIQCSPRTPQAGPITQLHRHSCPAVLERQHGLAGAGQVGEQHKGRRLTR